MTVRSRVDLAVNDQQLHMSDSIQGTDYIATYFFLNLKVSRAKIENLK